MKKDFEEIACIFCGWVNNTMADKCIHCTRPLHIEGQLINQDVNAYKLIDYKARGFYGLTFKAVDGFSKEVAIKLMSKISYLRYEKDFKSEARLYAQLPDSASIVKYIGAGETVLSVDGNQVPFFYIVCEWVNGITLRDLLLQGDISPEDLIIAAKDLLSGLQELYDNNLWHNDLHGENILVSELTQAQMRLFARSKPRIYKIIDVGSMVYRNPSDVKVYNDMINVGMHLSQILKNLKTNVSEFQKEDQLLIDVIEEAFTRLMDELPSRSFTTPFEALDRIEELYTISRLGERIEIKKLDTPYGYINANDIPSPWLLKHMFSDKLNYFQDIMSADQQSLLITGPRGCGKTMILKNMRFTTLYDSQDKRNDEFIKQIPYVALFISARTNFGNYLVSYRPQEWINNNANINMYFNLLITIEAIDVLYRLSNDGFVSDSIVQIIIDFIREKFSIPFMNLLTARAKLTQLSKAIISDKDVKPEIENSSPAYLHDFMQLFRSVIPAIREKDIFILVDDLSLPRVPHVIQKALIPSIFNTGASYKTRVTSHSDGIILQDSAGEVYSPNRDFREIMLGYAYWELSNNYEVCRDCFDDILKKRFTLAEREDYPGIEGLLGKGEDDDIGRKIHRLKAQKKLRTLRYHGAKVFIKLCSGDISYPLDILGKMELRAHNNTIPIDITIQSDVIKNYARKELLTLQDIKAQYVPSLYAIAYYFGVLSKSKLYTMDADYLKIEVELENLSEELLTTLRELLCYGIFIDAGASNNSDGKLARKLFFRRIFTPAFPTTLITSNSISMRVDSFKEFVYHPAKYVRKKMSKAKISPLLQQEYEQLELFP